MPDTTLVRLFSVTGELVATVLAAPREIIQWGERIFVRAPNQQYTEARASIATELAAIGIVPETAQPETAQEPAA